MTNTSEMGKIYMAYFQGKNSFGCIDLTLMAVLPLCALA